MNKDWSIRYDIVRRLPNGAHETACVYGDDVGFATAEEAMAVKEALDNAQNQVGLSNTFVVWPVAVHAEATGPVFTLSEPSAQNSRGVS